MITHTCDNCNHESSSPLQIEVRGYKPRDAGGILLPESFFNHQFCSHDCYVYWMRKNLREYES